MTRVSGDRLEPAAKKHRTSPTASNRFWQIAALTVAGTLGVTARADAAVFWSDPDSAYSRPVIVAPPRAHRARRKEKPATVKETAKPQGPLIINVSISRQNVKIYDANGFFAEAPVSTGMAGHATPMGAFSVIQKQKMHHSNIYSNAPMPFMQRITWSGVAMHAGVLPGYPASHGCIRMPMAFAIKMYGWTRMGARVIVTPGELTPQPFSHPLLVTQKIAPQPVAVDVPKPDASAKGDKVANTEPKPAALAPNLGLRSTVGHDSQLSTMMNEPPRTPLSKQTHTADAAAPPAAKASVTMSDAMAAMPQASDNAVPSAGVASATEHADNAGTVDSERKSDTEKSEAEPATNEITDKTAEIAAADQTDQTKAEDAPNVAEASGTDAVKTDLAAAAETAKASDVKAPMPAANVAKVTEKVADKPDDKASAKPGDDVTATTAAPSDAVDAKEDQDRLADPQKPAAPAKPALAMAKGSGPISVFISRKDGKLYVRQNFAPLFDVPVTIAASDRPLGTHIFTTEVDKNDANILHWSVVTLPASHRAERREDDARGARHRKVAGAVEIAKPVLEPDSPAEALDRITIPADVMARITEALSTGGSIIVSDQGIAAGETGEGTDFIVSLR
jgi:lipoprotein-anchoring transpeptidase ErfK/SrfK